MSPAPFRWGWAAAVSAVLLIVRVWAATRLDLLADEAYYWTWAQELAAGYFDHPPGVAWSIAGSTALFGDLPWAVRLPGILMHSVALGALVGHLGPRQPLLLLLLTPGVLLAPILATPDAGFLGLGVLALVAHQRERPLLAGTLAGLAVLFKLPAVALLPAFLLARRQDWWDWAAPGMALLITLPMWIWNAQHGWPTLGFQAEHGLGGEGPWGPAILDGLGFIGGQLIWLGPIAGLAGMGWLLRGSRSVWWWAALIPAVVFGLASLRSHAELNWGLPVWTFALGGLASLTGRWQRWLEVGSILGAGLSLLAVLHLCITPLWTLDQDPRHRFMEGPILGQSVQAWGIEPVLTSRYQEAALIRFYGQISASTVPNRGRQDQFDLWREASLPQHTLFVRPARRSTQLATDDLPYRRGQTGAVHLMDGDRRVWSWQVQELTWQAE